MKTFRPNQPSEFQRPASEQTPVAPPPKPAPWLTVTPDRVDLVSPHIWLQGYLVIRDANGGMSQVKELTPSRAFIAEGALVIEEMDLVMPLASVQTIRKEKP